VFDIPAGDNLSSISKRLVAMDALPVDEALFKAMALMTRDEGAILAGQYQIIADMTAEDLLALFRSGRVIQYRLTFPEGWTLDEWMMAMAEAPHLKYVSGSLSRSDLAARLGLMGDPEGWFFPDTYVYRKGDTDLTILNQAYRRMEAVLEEEWQERGPVAHITSPAEALTLASIIEKETGFEPDRPRIASVFHNRLARRMKLQSDPTVIFGLGDTFDGDLTRSHLKTDTLYNTYTRSGLPPGPICSPGRASIKAALAGSAHGYLYFVAMGEGKSFFSDTLAEHNQAVNRYQKRRQSNP
ncbi:MAG: endolytic transglycosylase MltG, partial [Gammaproteobacteria bacterium]|nr:endolytic transglycosylase MltG [Gammaproteobacteria bacterium]